MLTSTTMWSAYAGLSDHERGSASPSSSSLPTTRSTGNCTPGYSSNSPLLLSPVLNSAGTLWKQYGGQEPGAGQDLATLFSVSADEIGAGHSLPSNLEDANDDLPPARVPNTMSSTLGFASAPSFASSLVPTTICPEQLAACPAQQASYSSSASSADDSGQQRRQGVTCDHCRSKHIRCVPSSVGMPGSNDGARCQRCAEKDLDCTRTYRPPSRRYPRPSRTGKRIEQARVLHGSINGAFAASVATGPHDIFEQVLRPTLPHHSNVNLQNDILAGSTSLRLLTCFFATAHMQMPIVDFHNFSARYNFAHGDCRIMSIMARGGDDVQKIPAARQSAPGLLMTVWPPGSAEKSSSATSTLSTPGTTEALIAAMHAWAALYTDMPIAFGSAASQLALRPQATQASSDGAEGTDDPARAAPAPSEDKAKRSKRKQGVACDTCRLRRLRCDKLERPEGMGCTRCEDKRIVCTDEYIQVKRRKAAEQERKASLTSTSRASPPSLSSANLSGQHTDEHDVIGSSSRHARDVPVGSGPASWKASEAQTRWIDAGPNLPNDYRFGQARRMLAYGHARQAFFGQLLQRALELVYRHKLMEQPSIEAIQVMSILVQVLDMISPSSANSSAGLNSEPGRLAEACSRHARVLGLESTDEVDEQDRHAVEQLLGAMQRKRLWCCVWTRDALVSGLFRKPPAFAAERALGIRGNKSRSSPATDQGKGYKREPLEPVADSVQTSLPKLAKSTLPELNGEMGLSFSILAVMQIGALSRFAGKHLDNIEPPSPAQPDMDLHPRDGSLLPPAMRFPLLPSRSELKRLTRACHALWRSIDSLLLFFDKCAVAAQNNMDDLHPFQPLGWIATIKVAGTMLDFCSCRILGERVHLGQTYLLAIGASNAGQSDPSEDRENYSRLLELQALQQASQRRTLIGCRRLVRLVEHLLSKQVFQTGGLLLRHIVLVAQYLARSPVEASDAFSSGLHAEDGSTTMGIDLQSVSTNSQTQFDDSSSVAVNRASGRGVRDALSLLPLEPFDAARKHHEVQVCLEAVAQLGYAWPGMDTEISIIEEMLRGSATSSASSSSSA